MLYLMLCFHSFQDSIISKGFLLIQIITHYLKCLPYKGLMNYFKNEQKQIGVTLILIRLFQSFIILHWFWFVFFFLSTLEAVHIAPPVGVMAIERTKMAQIFGIRSVTTGCVSVYAFACMCESKNTCIMSSLHDKWFFWPLLVSIDFDVESEHIVTIITDQLKWERKNESSGLEVENVRWKNYRNGIESIFTIDNKIKSIFNWLRKIVQQHCLRQ